MGENASGGGKRTSVSPIPTPAKRLKQACLPFKVISPDIIAKSATPVQEKRPLGHSSTPADSPVKNLRDGSNLVAAAKPNSEPTVDNCKENQSPVGTCKRKKLFHDAEREHDISCNHLEAVIDLTEDSCGQAGAAEEERRSSDADLESSLNVALSQPDSVTSGNLEQAETVSTEVDDKVFNVSASPSLNDPPVIAKKVKVLRKRKRNPKEELEKAKRMEERKKAQEEKEKLKAELQRLREQRGIERLKKEKEKLERREQGERERQDKQRQKEEEKRKKQDVLDAKLEEKERKKKEKSDLDDEKRKVEEEEARKKNKVKTAFASFFVKKESAETVWQKPKNLGTFLPFQVKENMRLAPVHRNMLSNLPEITQKMDSMLSSQNDAMLYLEEFKKLKRVPRKSNKTWAAETKDVEVVEVGCDVAVAGRKPARAKLLQFEENIRPPYWGTWCKRSSIVTPRHPLKRDKNLDYEVDSAEEWEEEEPGESLSHTEDEKESEDDYEVDNDFFVPHGYLSDEEGHDDDKRSVSPNTLKVQLQLKEQEFQKDRKKKCTKIKPIVFGCIWMDDSDTVMNKALGQYAAVMTGTSPIDTRFTFVKVTKENEKTKKPPSLIKYQKEISADVMPDFIRLVHGNQNGFRIIYAEFEEFLLNRDAEKRTATMTAEKGSECNGDKSPAENACNCAPSLLKLSKCGLRRTIKAIASWGKFPERGALYNKFAWAVNKEIRVKYDQIDLPIPNEWKYFVLPEVLKNVESTAKHKSQSRRIPDSFFLKQPSILPKLKPSDPASCIEDGSESDEVTVVEVSC